MFKLWRQAKEKPRETEKKATIILIACVVYILVAGFVLNHCVPAVQVKILCSMVVVMLVTAYYIVVILRAEWPWKNGVGQ